MLHRLQLCVVLLVAASVGKCTGIAQIGEFVASHEAYAYLRSVLLPPTHLATDDHFKRATAYASPVLLAPTRHITQDTGNATGPTIKVPPGHKPLFPVGSLDIAVLVIAGVVLFIAAGAGMGGGPVLVPLYLVAGLDNTAAVALSNTTILAGSVGNTLCNVFKRHPYKNKPLIDWDLVLLMEPPTLIGAIAGSYINKLLPAWITSVLLVLLLGLMTVRIAQRAARIYARESAAKREAAAADAATAATAAAPADAAALIADERTGHAQRQDQSMLHLLPHIRQHSSLHAPRPRAQQYAAAQSKDAVFIAGTHKDAAAVDQRGLYESFDSAEGVLQLLAEERATRVGPSDQPPVQQQPGQHISQSSSSTAGNAVLHTFNSPTHAPRQQQQHNQHRSQPRLSHSHQQQGAPAAAAAAAARHLISASAPASPFERPSSPVLDSSTTAGGVPAGQMTPFRGTLSTVPSSVLLNAELEGNISEAALQRLAMLETSTARNPSMSLDAADASLASMYGITAPHWQQQQQRASHNATVRDQQQDRHCQWQQQQERSRVVHQQVEPYAEPPSEAECRLAYAPPGHTRRDSWELAWEDEQQEAAASGEPSAPVASGESSAAAGASALNDSLSPEQGTGTARRVETLLLPSTGTFTGPPAAAAPAAAPAAVRRAPRLLAHTAAPAAPAPAPLAVTSVAGSAAGQHVGSIELAAAGHVQLQPLATSHGPQAAGSAAAAVAATRQSQSAAASSSSALSGNAAHGSSSITSSRQAGSADSDGRPPIDSSSASSGRHRQQPKAPEVAAATRAAAIERMLAAEAVQLPLLPVLLLLAMFAAVLLTSLFSKMAPCGSAGYWVVQWSVVPVLLGIWWFSRRRVLAKVAVKKAAQLDFHGEVRWTPRKSLLFPAICSLAGIIAGMFGLGGAVVKTPLMLELGVHPSVTAATTQTMLLLTSSASSIVYAQLGDTPWDWASVMLPMAFAATLAGQTAIDWLVKKVGRSSMVVLVLAAFFIVATCLSVYTLSGAARAVAAHPELLGQLGKVCR